MKYVTITKLMVATVLVATLFAGCDTLEFEEASKTYDGEVQIKFTDSEISLFAEDEQDEQTIEVSTLRPVSEARTYSFSVVDDELTTAVEGEDYTLESTEITIPADEVLAEIPITIIKENIADAPTLHLEITSEEAASYNASIVITMRQFFPYNQEDFVGDFELVYPWWFEDEQPRIVTSVAGDDENTIIVQNMLGTGSDIEFTLDDSNPANFTVAFNEPVAWVSGQNGDVRMDGSGTFDAESFIIQATAEHTVSAGTFGEYPFTMTKVEVAD